MDGPAPEPSEKPAASPTAEWPNIADYWPDGKAGRNTGQEAALTSAPTTARASAPSAGPAAAREADPASPRLITPPPPSNRHGLRVVAAAAGAVIFLGVSVAALTRLVAGPDEPPLAVPSPPVPSSSAAALPQPNPPVSIQPTPSTSPAAPEKTTPAPPPFRSATFDLISNVAELNLSIGRPADGVVEVRTAKDSGIRTRTKVDGDSVFLLAEPNGRKGPSRVDVVLDERVAWKVRMTGGVSKAKLGLAGGTIRGVDLAGGAATIDLALPRQQADIPIRMSGGVRTWRIRTERKIPVKVEVRKGAGEVVLYGDRERGVDRGETVRAGGRGDGRLEIEAVAGLGSLTVTSW